MTDRRLTIYGNWSAYDELSDGVPLTEELAMRQLQEVLRLRSNGVHIDAYLMDAFWFDPEGGYRTWRTPNWPTGPDNWLKACKDHGLIPGLWFTANTLCHLHAAPAWLDSADENKWGLCCFHGGFLADYVDLLSYWYGQGIRIFKLDFADFSAAPPSIKSKLSPESIRVQNIAAFRQAMLEFRESHPEAIVMGFNGFECKEFMDRTDRPLEKVFDLAWLDVFDCLYSGDPRPADVPTVPIWRSVDIYGDHTTRILQHSGIPLAKIDNCGFMAGPTGTCYWRGKALWKGMFLLTLMRGGDLTVLYGDLTLFDDADVQWMAAAQQRIEAAFRSGPAQAIGGIPGQSEPYGWFVGDQLLVVVNPAPTPARLNIPEGPWQILFQDASYKPNLDKETIELGPFQMALLAQEGPDLGVQDASFNPKSHEIFESEGKTLTAEVLAGDLIVFVRQRDAEGRLIRTYAGAELATHAISLSADRGELITEHHRVIWSGMSWSSATIRAEGPEKVKIQAEAQDAAKLELHVLTL